MRAVHCSNRRARLVSLVASGFFMMSAAIAAQPPVAKLDATLRLLSEQPAAALRIFADELAGADSALKSKTARMWPITIRLSDSADPEAAIAAMRGAGVVVRSRFGTIIVADAPIDALVHLAAFDEILQLETSRAAPLRLNVSVPATGAASLRSGTAPNWTGLTGKGVIVGVIDDGVDFRHQDFRNADGSTRILSLWTSAPPAPRARLRPTSPTVASARRR